ncbi:hypothetical protein [Streptomyces glaucus]|uniref:hypothetical protein n=1 Tax=Streptomyces glaucus TaxID=284029 RepID=UPI0031DBBB13
MPPPPWPRSPRRGPPATAAPSLRDLTRKAAYAPAPPATRGDRTADERAVVPTPEHLARLAYADAMVPDHA